MNKWLSNDKDVFDSIPVEERHAEAIERSLDQGMLPTERALGVTWDLEADHLIIRTSHKCRPATTRGLLSIVSSENQLTVLVKM